MANSNDAEYSELMRLNTKNNDNSTSTYLQDNLSRSHRALLPEQHLRDPASENRLPLNPATTTASFTRSAAVYPTRRHGRMFQS